MDDEILIHAVLRVSGVDPVRAVEATRIGLECWELGSRGKTKVEQVGLVDTHSLNQLEADNRTLYTENVALWTALNAARAFVGNPLSGALFDRLAAAVERLPQSAAAEVVRLIECEREIARRAAIAICDDLLADYTKRGEQESAAVASVLAQNMNAPDIFGKYVDAERAREQQNDLVDH